MEFEQNENWMFDAVTQALELEQNSNEESFNIQKKANDIGIGPGAVIGGLLGAATTRKFDTTLQAQQYKMQAGNAVARILNEENKHMVDMGSNYYTQIENIDKDLKIMFTPLSVVFMLRHTVVDVMDVSSMTSLMKDAWRRKDAQYFKNIMVNKIYLDAQDSEQMFIKRFIEQDSSLRGAIGKSSSDYASTYVEDFPDMDFFTMIKQADYLKNMFDKAETSPAMHKYANLLVKMSSDWEHLDIPMEMGASLFFDEKDYDLGQQKLAFLWMNKDHVDREVLTPRHLRKRMQVVFLPDRVLYVSDNIVVSQLNTMKMNEEGYDKFANRDDHYFHNLFFDMAKRAGSISDDDFEKEADTECPSESTGGLLRQGTESGGINTFAEFLTALRGQIKQAEEKDDTETTTGPTTNYVGTPPDTSKQEQNDFIEGVGGIPRDEKNERTSSMFSYSEKLAVALDDSFFLGDILSRGGVHPKVYYLLMMKEFGPEWLEWDMDTLESMLQDVFKVEVSDIVLNKIMSISLVINSDSAYTGYHTFEKVTRAFNDKLVDFELQESNLSLGEIMNSLRIMCDITGVGYALYDRISEHVEGYIVEVLAEQNYRVVSISPADNMEKLFWDLVNIELLEYWVGKFPNGFGTVSADGNSIALEAKGMQSITKEVCNLNRNQNINFAKIHNEINEKITAFGYNTDSANYYGIIMDNVMGSLAVDYFLKELEVRRDEQIRAYVK